MIRGERLTPVFHWSGIFCFRGLNYPGATRRFAIKRSKILAGRHD